jgi:hypothetical protein
VKERIAVEGSMVWMAVLAIVLLARPGLDKSNSDWETDRV